MNINLSCSDKLICLFVTLLVRIARTIGKKGEKFPNRFVGRLLYGRLEGFDAFSVDELD